MSDKIVKAETALEEARGGVDRGVHTHGMVSRYTDEEREKLRALGGLDEASDGDLDMLATVAARTGLDPFIKQIYLVGRKTKTGGYRGEPERWETKWTVQAGIDGFRQVLFRTADAKGVDCEISAPRFYTADGVEVPFWSSSLGEHPEAAIVEVSLGGRRATGIATWDEFASKTSKGALTSMWKKFGPTMLAKCAEAQAHRKVNSLTAGLYSPEEMMQATPAKATARRVENARGASGLRAALAPSKAPANEAPAPVAIEAAEAVDVDDLQILIDEINAATTRGELAEIMRVCQSNLTEAEYAPVKAAGTARWEQLPAEDKEGNNA